mgnify:CR=1 FL=1
MRAVVTTGHGGLDRLEVREVPVPRPGPDQVLVRVAAAACNNTDLWTREGTYGTADQPSGWIGPVGFPRIQGGDAAGTVVAVGDGVDSGLEGRRVLVDPAIYDEDGLLPGDILGSERDGGFAEYLLAPACAAHVVDGSPLSDPELASLPIAYGTALGMLERSGARAGDTVLATGASGGVGVAAVQLAKARGCTVVAVSSGDKADAVREAGADHVVDRGRGSLVDDVRRVAPAGLHAVIDVVAGPFLTEGLSLLRPGARWVVAGSLAGAVTDVDVRKLYLANQSLVGSTMHTPGMFADLAEMARRGTIRPLVAQTFALADLARAQEVLLRREHVGKLVVLP